MVGAYEHEGQMTSEEEHLIREIIEIGTQAQEQVLLAQKLREVHSHAATHFLYGHLQANLARLAQKCEQAHLFIRSWLNHERP